MNEKIATMVKTMIKKMEETNHLPWDIGFVNNINRIPRNFLSKKPYRGFNFFYLMDIGIESEYNEYATFKQVASLNGRVNQGAKAKLITFFNLYNKTKKQLSDPKKDDDDDEIVPFWKCYNVFAVEDTNLELPQHSKNEVAIDYNETYDEIDRFIERYVKADEITYNVGDTTHIAYYDSKHHLVSVSDKALYTSATKWYSTVLHELVHSSKKGLKRNISRPEEEIVAEFGAALLCEYFGIRKEREVDNEAAYIKSWSKTLSENPQWLFDGAQKAQKAVDYLLAQAGLLSFSEKFSN